MDISTPPEGNSALARVIVLHREHEWTDIIYTKTSLINTIAT